MTLDFGHLNRKRKITLLCWLTSLERALGYFERESAMVTENGMDESAPALNQAI